MAIDLYNTLKNTSQWAFGSAILNGILSSSIFVAFVIALLMMLLIMLMYPAKSGTSFSVIFKLFVYMFLGSLFIVFLHDGVLTYMIKEEHSKNNSDALIQDVFEDAPNSITSRPPAKAPIKIQDTETEILEDNISEPDDTPTQLNTRGSLSGPKPPVTGGNPYF
jgi:hypothetical protein